MGEETVHAATVGKRLRTKKSSIRVTGISGIIALTTFATLGAQRLMAHGSITPGRSAQLEFAKTSYDSLRAQVTNGQGYWLVTASGKVTAFGGAVFYGDLSGRTLNKPIVSMSSTPDGKGYWLFAADGGVFSFGDAKFYGSQGGARSTAPFVAGASVGAQSVPTAGTTSQQLPTQWMGQWQSSSTYQPSDVVSLNGSSWFATNSIAAGVAPGTSGSPWQLLAAGGTTGPQGPTGPQGSPGPMGIAGPGEQVFTALVNSNSGNYTVPAGASQIEVEVWGGGGGGGGNNGGGGGAGGLIKALIPTSTGSCTVTVGGGGNGSTGNGGNGGDSTVSCGGLSVTANGGAGGVTGGSGGAGGNGGTTSYSSVTSVTPLATTTGGNGSTGYGGNGGNGSTGNGGNGGGYYYFANSNGGTGTSNGGSGSDVGTGGGGGYSSGGNGAPGLVIVIPITNQA